MDHDKSLRAIWELTDKQTRLMIRASQIAEETNNLSSDIHEVNMAWRKLAMTLGGISQREYETFVLRLKDTEDY